MPEILLGISAYYHDSAAAILIDGELIAAAHEERFSRKKHDSSFPTDAARYVLKEAGVNYGDLSAVVFYDKPFLKFERLLETYHAFVPEGLKSFLSAIPVWIKEKLFMKKMLNEELAKLGNGDVPLLFPEHHLSHAASAFYPSPFHESAILTIDGVGEWATSMIGYGQGNDITVLKEQHFPHSVGLLYSAFTYYTGFRVNSGEYKLMGLAPYGNQHAEQTKAFIEKIKKELIDIRKDGSLLFNMEYFDFATGLRMANDEKWEQLFEIPPRKKESRLTQEYMNMAYAIQQVTEDIILKLAHTVKELTDSPYLTLAGGVALNCVANGKLLEEDIFDEIWIQPAAGDAGGALGAAYAAWHIWMQKERSLSGQPDKMKNAYLGPSYDGSEIRKVARKYEAPFHYRNDFDELSEKVAQLLANGNVIGWFQGRMEYGPRALGNRSILGDPRDPVMQKKMNVKIKYRESFRPFAPSVLEEDIDKFFDIERASPYMLLVRPVRESHLCPQPANYQEMDLKEKLYHERSDLPAITHIDYSARIQSVSKDSNPRYWTLINDFKKRTGYGIVVNTSFNVRGEPIVCTPDEAFQCFMRTDMDYLVMDNYLFDKDEQQELEKNIDWSQEFQLD